MISAPAEVVVFLAVVTAPQPSLLRLLEPAEHERASAFVRPGDRDRFITSHALLRLAAGEVFGVSAVTVNLDFTCRVCGGPHGRPSIAQPAVLPGSPSRYALSLSTSADRVAVAVARVGDVGVDIDRVDAAQFSGFDTVALTAREVRAVGRLGSGDADLARSQLWVRKEAVLKASGHGLRREPRTIDVWAKGSTHTGSVDLDIAATSNTSRVRWIDLDTGVPGLAAAVARVGAEPVHVVVRDAEFLLSAGTTSGSR
ncbi:4'-phosphopantetheinyl transferase superfamily protein [Subtercola sp. PAMC28395]|uniref:4'-phosphopantetheinyl transferase family protein n=1 Tax=Subtercola sp. PAMC28395 TaxID=2846775 RepID=UPI001C0BFCA2|nr:4'-phosphopantetheinyl transferase superfamily protein [Subtercola sp. PAMC28395]QWT22996.1 4'-phosphopantetheinyl transferase superfamily protein [Subtercola sp. PAMC28395]